MKMEKKVSGKALLPFGVFVGVYLITGIVLNMKGVEMAFYQLPTNVAAIIGVIFAFVFFKGTMDEKLQTFLKGCGHTDVMTMCFIFLFAGAFTTVSSEMGGVDAVVNLGMSVLPPQFVAAGVFVISGFIGISTGTSVGTVVAVTPIAIGLAQAGGLNEYLVVAATICGAMFGDNLSMISDTTIAATRTQGVEMKDKFRTNFSIVLPAAIITVILLLIFGRPDVVPEAAEYSFDFIKVLPYAFVLAASLFGVNVFIVLTGGIIFSGVIGIAMGSFTALEFANHIYTGFTGMFEIFLLSMLMGGLATLVQEEGGIEWVLQKVKKIIKNRHTAEAGIAAMVSVADIATANNTVSILVTGNVAKELSEEYGVDPKRTASLLDIFACVFQGILPYSAQILFACALMENLNSPFQVISFCWYQYIVAVIAVASIFFAGKIKKKA
ncbi:Na+/H+ antiporter NhaC family protein [Faecalicatena contorta]|nr:Na+/H+ antiporter NhaC family protein [Faecalicatena contorta]MCF2681166.1 Na+/H+ antiporter NhaC family protein [Faecalicatena contorta]